VVHVYNPSYSGDRDQEDHGSRPVLVKSLQDSTLKNPITKKGWRCRATSLNHQEEMEEFKQKGAFRQQDSLSLLTSKQVAIWSTNAWNWVCRVF
jgi:hypothetical protein